MKNKLVIHILNLFLVIVLLALVIVPTLGGSFLVVKGPIDLSGRVAGWRSRPANFTVIPNTVDFGDRVSFQSLQASDDIQVEKVTLSNFPGYLAIYNQLYSIENHGREPLTLKARLLKLPQPQTFSFLTISLAPQNQPYATSLLNDEPIGSTLIEVEDSQIFYPRSWFLIEEEMAQTLTVSGNSLVSTPLKKPHSARERVYASPIVVDERGVLKDRTQEIYLSPGEKAYLTFTVKSKESPAASPPTFSLQFSMESL